MKTDAWKISPSTHKTVSRCSIPVDLRLPIWCHRCWVKNSKKSFHRFFRLGTGQDSCSDCLGAWCGFCGWDSEIVRFNIHRRAFIQTRWAYINSQVGWVRVTQQALIYAVSTQCRADRPKRTSFGKPGLPSVLPYSPVWIQALWGKWHRISSWVHDSEDSGVQLQFFAFQPIRKEL